MSLRNYEPQQIEKNHSQSGNLKYNQLLINGMKKTNWLVFYFFLFLDHDIPVGM